MTTERKPQRLRLNGTRGSAVLVLGLAACARGMAYLPPLDSNIENLPGGLQSITEIVSINTWGLLWLGAGLYGVFCAFRAKDVKAISYIVGMHIAWGLAYLIGWINSIVGPETVNRDWLSAVNYISQATFIAIIIKLLPEQEELPIAPFPDRDDK